MGTPAEPLSPPPPAAADHPPDWSATPDDLPCPLCAYNLRGLITPRCPECGYAFTWPALLAARDSLHPYLFEHHPHRAGWSFRQTFSHAFRPRRFWTTLSPAHTVRPRRLLLYWLLVLALTLAASAAPLAIPVSESVAGLRWERARALQGILANRPGLPVPQQLVAQWYPPAWTPRGLYQLFGGINVTLPSVTLFVLAWPWLTAASLLLFQQSMRRARIRPAQVLRCAVYSSDPAALALLIIALWSATTAGPLHHYPPINLLMEEELLICLVAGHRLATAYRHYLTFSHALATVAATQFIVFLLGLILWFRLI